MAWTPVPPPPAPTGINQLPAMPKPAVCWTGSLPWMSPAIKSKTLTVNGVWVLVVSGTASPNSTFKKTVTYESGASFTTGTESEFAGSLEVKSTLLDIGASLSKTTSEETTLSANVTHSYEFELSSEKGEVTVAVWQLVYTYTIVTKSEAVWPVNELTITNVMVDATEVFANTQFPPATSVTNLAGGNAPALDRLFAAPAAVAHAPA